MVTQNLLTTIPTALFLLLIGGYCCIQGIHILLHFYEHFENCEFHQGALFTINGIGFRYISLNGPMCFRFFLINIVHQLILHITLLLSNGIPPQPAECQGATNHPIISQTFIPNFVISLTVKHTSKQ